MKNGNKSSFNFLFHQRNWHQNIGEISITGKFGEMTNFGQFKYFYQILAKFERINVVVSEFDENLIKSFF